MRATAMLFRFVEYLAVAGMTLAVAQFALSHAFLADLDWSSALHAPLAMSGLGACPPEDGQPLLKAYVMLWSWSLGFIDNELVRLRVIVESHAVLYGLAAFALVQSLWSNRLNRILAVAFLIFAPGLAFYLRHLALATLALPFLVLALTFLKRGRQSDGGSIYFALAAGVLFVLAAGLGGSGMLWFIGAVLAFGIVLLMRVVMRDSIRSALRPLLSLCSGAFIAIAACGASLAFVCESSFFEATRSFFLAPEDGHTAISGDALFGMSIPDEPIQRFAQDLWQSATGMHGDPVSTMGPRIVSVIVGIAIVLSLCAVLWRLRGFRPGDWIGPRRAHIPPDSEVRGRAYETAYWLGLLFPIPLYNLLASADALGASPFHRGFWFVLWLPFFLRSIRPEKWQIRPRLRVALGLASCLPLALHLAIAHNQPSALRAALNQEPVLFSEDSIVRGRSFYLPRYTPIEWPGKQCYILTDDPGNAIVSHCQIISAGQEMPPQNALIYESQP